MTRSQRKYITNYGWNFSRKACEEAVKRMQKWDGNRIQMKSREDVMETMKRHNVELEHDNGYNAVYVFHMVLADFYGKSIEDDKHLCLHVKCIIDDRDNQGGNVFRKWYADQVANGNAVEWEDLTD